MYSQPGTVMNEQCVWRQIELDTTHVLEQRTNQYFFKLPSLVPMVLHRRIGGFLQLQVCIYSFWFSYCFPAYRLAFHLCLILYANNLYINR